MLQYYSKHFLDEFEKNVHFNICLFHKICIHWKVKNYKINLHMIRNLLLGQQAAVSIFPGMGSMYSSDGCLGRENRFYRSESDGSIKTLN